MKYIVSILVLALGFSAQAKSSHKKFSKAQIDKIAAEYFVNESKQMFSLATEPRSCDDQQDQGGRSCTDVACDLVGSYNCNDVSEIERIGNACRGNHSGRCLESLCNKVGSYNCNDISEIEQVAASCRGSLNEKCVDKACEYVGSYNCNDISEIQRIGAACRGVRASCLESVCNRVGSYNCNDISEIEQIAGSCRGN
jgi:hypothetical protein